MGVCVLARPTGGGRTGGAGRRTSGGEGGRWRARRRGRPPELGGEGGGCARFFLQKAALVLWFAFAVGVWYNWVRSSSAVGDSNREIGMVFACALLEIVLGLFKKEKKQLVFDRLRFSMEL